MKRAMADYTVKRIDDMDAAFWGSYKRARAELGVTAFGMQVIDVPAGATQYPEHDHTHDDQEEVFVALRGSAEIELDGERVRLDPDTLVRVGVEVWRKVWPGDDGVRLLIVSGVPGRAYDAPEISQIGAPESVSPVPPST